jgi:hypothetical protein
MKLELVETVFSLMTLVPIIVVFMASSGASPLAAVSLPCMTALTSFIYFYLMPVIALAAGDNGFFGIYITTLDWTHAAAALYVMGAAAAFFVHRRVLSVNPAAQRPTEGDMALPIFLGIWVLAIGGVVFQAATGRLNLFGAQDYNSVDPEGVARFAFVDQAYNMMVPLALVALLRDRFSLRSTLLLLVVLAVFLQAGFRFRIMILLAGVATSYALTHGLRFGFTKTALGTVVALIIVNVIGTIRQYGLGVNLSNLNTANFDSMMSSFGGEFGTVYVLNYTAENPLPAMVTFEPWIVGFARLVPSFLWPDKPTGEYLHYFIAGTTVGNADKAGVAAPQHVEMLLQFGWVGLPVLAFLYFSLAGFMVSRLLRLGREARIAGCALVPAYFGYYMQTRGYFFQIFADGIFIFMPLFLVHLWDKRPAKTASRLLHRKS